MNGVLPPEAVELLAAIRARLDVPPHQAGKQRDVLAARVAEVLGTLDALLSVALADVADHARDLRLSAAEPPARYDTAEESAGTVKAAPLAPTAVELLTVLLEAVSVPYENSPDDYRTREDLLNARLADVRLTLKTVIDDPAADLPALIAQERQWVQDVPVTFTPSPHGLDDEWEDEQ